MYGPPGNGKSSISNGIRAALGDKIYVPRAIEYSGQVITVYDPIVHSAAEAAVDDPNALRRTGNRFDNRYVFCERPTVITGGELTLDMLDLKYNPTARTYTAPLQLKASGGIFIVDDLGRQAEPPQKLVNRWIVPLEEGRDILRPAIGREVHRALRHAGDLFDQLPPERNLRRRGPAADLLQDQDRRARRRKCS